MPCHYPIRAWQVAGKKDGKPADIIFHQNHDNILRDLLLPCGQCLGCKAEHSRQWAIRCMHEANFHINNCVATLTYNDEHLPDGENIQYSDFQQFMRRLRHAFRPTKIRFFACGEYGETLQRPHFHTCLFGIDFPDKIYFKTTKAGSRLYTSKTLEELWPHGWATLGHLTLNSAGYIARYVLKKNYGGNALHKYDAIDYETGEVWQKNKEVIRMSLKPGIGKQFLDKYHRDIFPHDIIVIDGIEMKPPRYYMRQIKKTHPDLHEQILFGRHQAALPYKHDNTQERREVKEEVLKAKLQFCKRELLNLKGEKK